MIVLSQSPVKIKFSKQCENWYQIFAFFLNKLNKLRLRSIDYLFNFASILIPLEIYRLKSSCFIVPSSLLPKYIFKF